MIYDFDRDKAIKTISEFIDQQDNDILQKIYKRIETSRTLSQTSVLKIWNRLELLESLDNAELDELLRVCLLVTESDEQHDEYFIEVDTSPIKKRYLKTVENPRTKNRAMQTLELLTEKVESVYHKDLCQLSYEEAIEGLSHLSDLSTASIRQVLIFARAYCEYCQSSGAFNGTALNSFKKVMPADVPIDTWVKNNIVKDPVDLVSRIEAVIPTNRGFMAPILFVLAWMQFKLDDCTTLCVGDVDVFEKTICGVSIPDMMAPIVISYLNEAKESEENPLFKKTKGKFKGMPCEKNDLRNAFRVMEGVGISYGGVRTSSLLYELYQREEKVGRVTNDDFIDCFELNPDTTTFNTYLKDKKRLYRVYKRIYWTP